MTYPFVPETLEKRLFLSAAVAPRSADLEPLVPAITHAINRRPTAVIDASPTSGQVPLLVTFDATNSTDPDGDPLTFTWDFGDGTGPVTGSFVQHAYTQRGVYRAILVAEDSFGARSVRSVRIFAGESAPVVQISAPNPDLLYQRGTVIGFAGDATDPDGDILRTADYTWSVVLVSGHRERLLGTIRGLQIGSFVIPPLRDANPNQFIRITLSVRDGIGLVGRDSVVIRPEVADLNLQSNVDNPVFRVDGRRLYGEQNVSSVVGEPRTVSATRTVVSNGVRWVFDRWSDDLESRERTLRIPVGGRTLVAIYRAVEDNRPSRGPIVFSTMPIRNLGANAIMWGDSGISVLLRL